MQGLAEDVTSLAQSGHGCRTIAPSLLLQGAADRAAGLLRWRFSRTAAGSRPISGGRATSRRDFTYNFDKSRLSREEMNFTADRTEA